MREDREEALRSMRDYASRREERLKEKISRKHNDDEGGDGSGNFDEARGKSAEGSLTAPSAPNFLREVGTRAHGMSAGGMAERVARRRHANQRQSEAAFL
mmetsp:Transcript_26872/g.79426  ORF Transcript_26872/g.79426 Transcript_26872/m.79426 type:complete len:100 (+) Transcript_26872:1618-1917(+)